MLENKKMDLQLFAEGTDGGSAGEGAAAATGVTETNHEDDIKVPSFVPEKRKKLFIETAKKNRSTSEAAPKEENPKESPAGDPTATPKEENKKQSFSELIESEEYKAEKEAYMHDAFKRRFSKYDGLEKENSAAKEILSQFAEKYGVDASSKTFFEDLQTAMTKDRASKRVEEYMASHDVDEDEAKRIVDMETTLAEKERQEKAQTIAREELERRNAQQKMINDLKISAENTKSKYPSFDLEKEMQNESFRRQCAAWNGDTTAAYEAVHHREILDEKLKGAVESAKVQVANAVNENTRRPSEGAMTGSASSVADMNFGNMDKKQLASWFAGYKKSARK
jgi:hypothetical protein